MLTFHQQMNSNNRFRIHNRRIHLVASIHECNSSWSMMWACILGTAAVPFPPDLFVPFILISPPTAALRDPLEFIPRNLSRSQLTVCSSVRNADTKLCQKRGSSMDRYNEHNEWNWNRFILVIYRYLKIAR